MGGLEPILATKIAVQQIYVCMVVLGAFFLFLREVLAVDLVAILVVLALLFGGILETSEALTNDRINLNQADWLVMTMTRMPASGRWSGWFRTTSASWSSRCRTAGSCGSAPAAR